VQVVKLPARDHNELATRVNQSPQGVQRWLVHAAPRRESAVVICSKGDIAHKQVGLRFWPIMLQALLASGRGNQHYLAG
jgi:hypothetical protein